MQYTMVGFILINTGSSAARARLPQMTRMTLEIIDKSDSFFFINTEISNTAKDEIIIVSVAPLMPTSLYAMKNIISGTISIKFAIFLKYYYVLEITGGLINYDHYEAKKHNSQGVYYSISTITLYAMLYSHVDRYHPYNNTRLKIK